MWSTKNSGGIVARPTRVTTDTATSIRPRESLLRNGLISSIAAGVPLFGVLYWMAFDQGTWGSVFVVQFVFLLFVVIGVIRFHAAYVTVTETSITKQAFATRTVVDRDEVANVLIAHTYRNGSSDTIAQFVARSADGSTLFRLRGVYWSVEGMQTVADAIGAPVFTENDPLTMEEFYRIVPDAPYWYEGKPALVIGGIVAAFIASLGVVSWLMTALGLPGIFGTHGG